MLPVSLQTMGRTFLCSTGHRPTNQDMVFFMYNCPDFFGPAAPRPGLYVTLHFSGVELRTNRSDLRDLVAAKLEDAQMSLRAHAQDESALLARDGLLLPIWFELQEDAMSGLPPATS